MFATPSDVFFDGVETVAEGLSDPDVISLLSDIRFLLALIVAWLTVFAIYALAKSVYQLVGRNITNYF